MFILKVPWHGKSDVGCVMRCWRFNSGKEGIFRSEQERGNDDSQKFGNFVSLMGLVDLPLLGCRFTWFRSNGCTTF